MAFEKDHHRLVLARTAACCGCLIRSGHRYPSSDSARSGLATVLRDRPSDRALSTTETRSLFYPTFNTGLPRSLEKRPRVTPRQSLLLPDRPSRQPLIPASRNSKEVCVWASICDSPLRVGWGSDGGSYKVDEPTKPMVRGLSNWQLTGGRRCASTVSVALP
jgi:hypothetical protein